MIEFTCKSPIVVDIPRKTKPPKRMRLNMNAFVNYHRFDLNKIKITYNILMRDQLVSMPQCAQIENITYQYFKPSNRKIDRANVLSIIEKFFCDALVYHRKIEDDNDTIIKSTTYVTGGVNPQDPHVLIKITAHPALFDVPAKSSTNQ